MRGIIFFIAVANAFSTVVSIAYEGVAFTLPNWVNVPQMNFVTAVLLPLLMIVPMFDILNYVEINAGLALINPAIFKNSTKYLVIKYHAEVCSLDSLGSNSTPAVFYSCIPTVKRNSRLRTFWFTARPLQVLFMSVFNTFVAKNADDIGFSQRNDWFGLFAEQFFQTASRRTF